jgi:hypothetical protein
MQRDQRARIGRQLVLFRSTSHNISQPGAYHQTVDVDPQTGLCGHERVDYDGTDPLTPLYGEVMLAYQGPDTC